MSEMWLETRTAAPDGRSAAEQPAWRRDFPIDVPQEQYVARRDFTKFMGLTSLAFVVGQFWIAAQNWVRKQRGEMPLVAIAELADVPVGGVVPFLYPSKDDPCLLMRPKPDTLLAYDQKCTHLSCAVVPAMSEGQLHCPCHHGVFELATGRPIAGPPRRPLALITLEIRKGTIYAVGRELRTV